MPMKRYEAEAGNIYSSLSCCLPDGDEVEIGGSQGSSSIRTQSSISNSNFSYLSDIFDPQSADRRPLALSYVVEVSINSHPGRTQSLRMSCRFKHPQHEYNTPIETCKRSYERRKVLYRYLTANAVFQQQTVVEGSELWLPLHRAQGGISFCHYS